MRLRFILLLSLILQQGCAAGVRIGGDHGFSTGAAIGSPPPVVISEPVPVSPPPSAH